MPPAHRVGSRLGGEINRRLHQPEQAGGADALRHPHRQRAFGDRQLLPGAPEGTGKAAVHIAKPPGAQGACRPDQGQRRRIGPDGSGLLRRGRGWLRLVRSRFLRADHLHLLGQKALRRPRRRKIEHTGGRRQRYRHQQPEQHHQPQPIAEPAAQPAPAKVPQSQYRQDQHRRGEQQFTDVHHDRSPPLPCGAVPPARPILPAGRRAPAAPPVPRRRKRRATTRWTATWQTRNWQ